MKRAIPIILVFLMGCAALLTQQSCNPSERDVLRKKASLDVIYEPTSYPILDEMLNMAEVTSEDTVVDLGCGDGRIVIRAAKQRGARGIGVDLDPVRIEESRKNAETAGVVGRVRFYEQDLFNADIADATVVMLYLFPEVNLRLRPKLLRDLKPGTRIVSHSHTMGQWDPDLIKNVNGHDLHFFVVPGNVTGTWRGTDPEGHHLSFKFTQKFQQVQGTMMAGTEVYPIRSCSLKGAHLSFTVERTVEGMKRLLFFEGLVSGETIEGNLVQEGRDPVGDPWRAARVPLTAVSIAE
ncbi:MAG: SAM-dependent methyltransferase [Deltaproteobacteria bacterium HGW-Deltaproteobacteria-15]|nr:MAG: SAM-dependent methyltransferase [Deltaproteobacteria bacterium HGW-Deltaproteobacteria-15]